jgi:transcriptional regulator with XRE-family HTH domain
MAPRQTALGRLLQQRRESAGYSRARVGELVGIKPGTIEGWELGRVARPPIHDVLRMAHFLGISPEEINTAVFEDAGQVAQRADEPERHDRKRGRRSRSEGGAVPLLEAAFRLFSWRDEAEAASALNTTPDQVARWRSGAETMAFADFLTLTSMIGIAAAEAMKGGEGEAADLSAAAEALGVRAPAGER